MNKVLEGLQELFDSWTAFALAQCGGCGTSLSVRDRIKEGLADIFAIQAVPELDGGEAGRLTQEGARLLNSGKFDEALGKLHDARRRIPASSEALCNIGCAQYQRGDEEAATNWYREAHRIAPRNELATAALAHLEQKAGHPADAQWLLANFLQDVNPNGVKVLRLLGKMQQDQSQFTQAARTYQRLMALQPDNQEWFRNHQACLDGSGQDTQANPKAALDSAMTPTPGAGAFATGGSGMGLQEARKLREGGQPVAALAAFKSATRTQATAVEAFTGIADCQSDLGNFEAATEAMKRVLSTAPDSPEANMRMAELLLEAGQAPAACEPYRKRALAGKENRELKMRLLCFTAKMAMTGEDYRQALSSASEAVRMDASEPNALLLLGKARLHVAEYDSAQRTCQALLEALSTGTAGIDSRGAPVRRIAADAHLLAALILERQRKNSGALDEVQKALELNPQLDSARVVMAATLHQMNRSREAVAELESILQRNAQHVLALLQLGYIQLCTGDARAVQTLEVASFGSSGAGSTLGAAKVYLALALDLHPELCPRGKPEQLLREGLGLHRNLRCVWQEIEQGLGLRSPVAAVQKLRGICDLDLSSGQARQLLVLLANAQGRPELAQAFSGLARPESAEPKSRGSRAPSVQPARWAPGAGGESAGGSAGPSAHQTPGVRTPVGLGAPGYAAAAPPGARQRSSSPMRWHFGQQPPGLTPDGGSFAGTPYRGRSGAASVDRKQHMY